MVENVPPMSSDAMRPDDAPAGFRPVVVIPTYNNARTLPDVLRRVQALALPMIVVNDGATDATAGILSGWERTASDIPAA